MPLTLTRRVRFSAAHRYLRPDWSAEKNAEVFGACARPNFHGHSYLCDVTVAGTLDEETGMICDLGALDRALDQEVRARFDMRNINLDVPEFADGQRIPTGEELARFIAAHVQRALGSAATVVEVMVAEDETLRATWTLG